MLLEHAHAVGTETVPLADAPGRVLAQTVHADRPSPACDVSAMDGYALRTSDLAHTASLTLSIVADAPPGVETFGGDVSELAANLRNDLAAGNKDVWLMGGGVSIAPFCKADLVDRYELYIMPVLLGTGIPLFPPNLKTSTELRLVRTRELPKGIVETIYEPANRAADAPSSGRASASN